MLIRLGGGLLEVGRDSAPSNLIGASGLPGKITAQGPAVHSTDAPKARP
jgi:hypothetical protein